MPGGDFDVVVTDGFAGNVILKYTEGIVGTVMTMLKRRMMETKRT
ncbi:MAG: glycerol-3-phosphate acyltransferase, partial [Eubacterium sp.]|nr:glycerol-3-phosphate acyltransferase [Eubacterium sp.]